MNPPSRAIQYLEHLPPSGNVRAARTHLHAAL